MPLLFKQGIRTFFGTPIYSIATLLLASVFALLILLYTNGATALEIWSFDSLSFFKRINLSISLLFDIKSNFTVSTLFLAFTSSLLGAFDIVLMYIYMTIRGEVITKSGLYSGIGLIFAFLGVGCVACGTAALSLVLSAIGATSALNIFPYHGEEIGYIGILVMLFSTYSLIKKVGAPNVC